MTSAILVLSATTPAILFTYLLLKYSIQRCATSIVGVQQINLKPLMVEQIFENHFEKLLAIEIHGGGPAINAYLNAKVNGSYQVLTFDGKLILEVRKNFSGWVVTREGDAVKNPTQFFTSLLLMLEHRFYN
ncbi:hypothetical protein [Pedobacter rhizosphaerae]|uniref:Uncharacterized protein n=1 Tax=Pedobacter rhizosphaerae TaxID=390241 RepID=A0A1H9STV6_9SPHI|nr:hypothetical protein [Pedobacter rhizosphaerae]SER88307.1 hypothetical protein SAMN04488023_11984 [Pedobacter rhizosphaerae]